MHVYEEIQELIGHTPLLKLKHMDLPAGADVYAKMEYMNPGGSMKDRSGSWMIADAERSGRLRKGGTIIEATAGNTGIGILYGALNKGYHVILVVPDCYSEEKQKIMKALGAQIIHSSSEGGMMEARKKAVQLSHEIENSIVIGQFVNPANPQSYYRSIGPELWEDLDGKVDAFVMGAGTGGTFSGVMRFLKEKNSHILGVLSDPKGSVIGGGQPGHYRIEGIGNDFVADTMDLSLVDRVYKISDQEAFGEVRKLAARQGILAGSSSGAAMAGAEKLIADGFRGNIVILVADRAERYLAEGILDDDKSRKD